jgi:hypothetical protein
MLGSMKTFHRLLVMCISFFLFKCELRLLNTAHFLNHAQLVNVADSALKYNAPYIRCYFLSDNKIKFAPPIVEIENIIAPIVEKFTYC